MNLRYFLAIDLSIETVENLARVQRAIAKTRPDLSIGWVPGPNIHVTLKYLGEVADELVPLINQAVESLVRPLFPFEVEAVGLGCFPDATQARILWAGLDEKGAEVMGLLHQAMERDLEELGFVAEDRTYNPHITLGRLQTPQANLEDLTQDAQGHSFGKSFVRDLVLFSSELREDGPMYRAVRRFPLG